MTPSGLRDLGTVLILTPPPINPKNDRQYRAATLSDTLRNGIEPFRCAPHGFYLIKDGLDGNGDTVFDFRKGDDIFAALEEAKRSADVPHTELWDDETVVIPQPSFKNATRDAEVLSKGFIPTGMDHPAGFKIPTTPYIGMARTPTEDDTLGPPQLPSNAIAFISKTERNSVIPVQTVGRASSVGYCMIIQFNRNTQHPADKYCSGLKYWMPIDTADAPIWFLDQPQRLQYITANGALLENSDMPKDLRKALDGRLWCPPAAVERAREDAEIRYYDGGCVRLRRWGYSYEVAILLPAWDWAGNRLGFSESRLPRIVAYAVNDKIIRQQYDGNIGLGVPGWTSPFTPLTYADEAVTLCDVLRRDRHVASSPMRMLIRLVHPSKEKACGIRAQSFVHFGEYWPCAVDRPGQGTHVPIFGEKIRIFPRRSGYTQWIVRLLSMTLLVPGTVGAQPSLSSTDARDWHMIPIEMPHRKDPSDDGLLRGIRVVLDTLTSRSFLPLIVINSIRKLWLKDDDGIYENKGGVYIPSESRLDGCDILFKFLGADGKEVPFRCDAKRFLIDAWQSAADELWHSPLRASETTFTLGVNFYWTAFVRHDAVFARANGGSHPDEYVADAYIRLAPQRVLTTDGRKFEEEHITFLEDGPGRLHDIERDLPQLKFD